jgi:UDP-N-acetylmuramoyl-L-alanyl-D-glutamate--2,6-diaminopimelate ligase
MKKLLRKLKLRRRGIALLAGMHFYGNPSAKLKIVGVTGTNGKTTTATLLYKITMALGHRAGLISTVENIINGKVITTEEGRPVPGTTPDPINLYKLLNKMVEEKCEYVFMEVSSHALDQSRVAGVNFTGGIFTNLTHDHLDYHKNFDNYFGAKKKFFKMLPAGAFALSNTDDEYGQKMLEGIKAKKYTYGFKKSADFAEKLETKLIGNFNTYNVLAVYATLVLLGLDKVKIKEQIKNVLPPKGRFDYFKSSSGVTVIVDYAHTPDALENVLKTIKQIANVGHRQNLPMSDIGKPKIISVFGCGGDRDPLKRPIMGKIGAIHSDITILTSDNPRSENPDKIIEQMTTNLSEDEFRKVKIIPGRHEAIREAVKLAQKGDIILAAGKGHEDYQEIKGVKHHFDDMEEFKKAFTLN